ncbi:M13 family metallopeptidase [Corynebacterium sp. MNWGS58]|uniref:M13 family metallopeptidase n=1 Tax=Corynebacterium sp. 102791.4 TaxID=3104612 RepID=UPI003513B3B5
MKDLYTYVNGPWLENHVIPDDRAVDGTFHNLRDQAEDDVREIVNEDNGRAGNLFASFMDTDGVNDAGLAPLDDDFALLSVRDIEEFVENLGALERVGVTSPLTFWVEKDSGSEDSVAYLVQSGLGLPDEAYYRSETHADTLAAYREHVATMLGFLDSAKLFGLDAEIAAERIVALETEIASGHWDVVASRDALKTYNPTDFDELPEIIQTLLHGGKLPEHRLVNMMPSYVEHLTELLTNDRLADWQLWATWHILLSRAGVLPEKVSEANFNFYGRRLTGSTEQRDRWKRGVGIVESMVGQEIGKLFVDKHFPASSKKDMLELVDYLIRAYRQRISNLEWMTQETRGRALEKLEQFKAKIGYPDKWRDYSGLEFSPHGAELVANVRAGAAFSHDYELGKVGEPARRDEWVANPQTVNAFYNPVVNDITFPAAILRAPFYNPDADAAENFGAIGSVIGHEIGHGFDDQGSNYDGQGNLNQWWSDEDRAAFDELTEKLVGQFEGLVPSVLAGEDGAPGVNGEFTLGENIGDLGGLGIAVVAYQLYLYDHDMSYDDTAVEAFDAEGAQPELYERKFNGLQRLFLAWGRVWRTAIRPEMAKQYLAIDPHSPAEFRCNQIAANIDEFYEAFEEVGPDSPMYLPPEQRVNIW